jgi:elongation factor Ts
MKINAQDVKKLRDKTQSGYMDCKSALIEAQGNMEKAQEILREKGFKFMENPTLQVAQGAVRAYIHPGNRIAVMLEMKCKTDFVARTKEFVEFANEMAMQVASMKPEYISRADVPLEVVSKEVGYRKERLAREGIDYEDEEFQTRLDGEMTQWYSEICLLEQPYIRDNKKSVKTLLAELISKVDEPCKITRFSRWEIEMEKEENEVQKEVRPLEIGWDRVRFQFIACVILISLLIFIATGIIGSC